jgi:hypothetical protein
VRSNDRMHVYKLGRPAPKIKMILIDLHFCKLSCSSSDSLIAFVLQIGDIDRATVYVSLAPGMEH